MRIPLACLALLLLGACRPAPAPTAPGAAAPAAADAAEQAPADTVHAGFRCGDLLVGAVFDNAAGNVTLSISGRRIVLPQAVSASGARYADDDGNEFWNKGDEATLALAGASHDCATTDQVSPWDAARDRGVAFRGIGTEPFWSLEVDGGEAPAMRLDLDMGERRLLVAGATALGDGAGWSGTADDGSAVTLRVAEGDCSDGMSDQTFPASVDLQVAGQAYRGCGAFLDR